MRRALNVSRETLELQRLCRHSKAIDNNKKPRGQSGVFTYEQAKEEIFIPDLAFYL